MTTLFFLIKKDVIAASITLSNGTPTTISNIDQEYQADVNLSINASDGTVYYLRGAFYQSGTTNYCGYSWNGSSWYKGPYTSNDGWKNLLPVTIASNSASVLLKAKLDFSDGACQNSGSYNFKVQRYTQSGSASFESQNEQSLTVIWPTSTPTLSPTSTLTPTPRPNESPTSTPAPTSKPQNSPTSKPSVTPVRVSPTLTPKLTSTPKDEEEVKGTVLGESISTSSSQAGDNHGIYFPLTMIFIGSGLLFISLGLFLAYRQKRKSAR